MVLFLTLLPSTDTLYREDFDTLMETGDTGASNDPRPHLVEFTKRTHTCASYPGMSTDMVLSLVLVAEMTGRDWALDDVRQVVANFHSYCDRLQLDLACLITSEQVQGSLNRGEHIRCRDFLAFRNYMRVACHNRKLFRTRNHYLGVGLKAWRVGDLVCVAFSAKIPFILGRESQRCLLVGGSDVYPMMQGEAIQ